MGRPDLTQQRLKEQLSYDPETGLFRWRVSIRAGLTAGAIAGYLRRDKGYIWIGIDGIQYAAHRLAWFYVYGVWPTIIDHRNGHKADNRLANLRDGTQGLNMQNQRRARSHNKSGFLGVHAYRKKWIAQIRVNGNTTYLGVFSTPEEAHAAYLAAKRGMHAFSQL